MWLEFRRRGRNRDWHPQRVPRCVNEQGKGVCGPEQGSRSHGFGHEHWGQKLRPHLCVGEVRCVSLPARRKRFKWGRKVPTHRQSAFVWTRRPFFTLKLCKRVCIYSTLYPNLNICRKAKMQNFILFPCDSIMSVKMLKYQAGITQGKALTACRWLYHLQSWKKKSGKKSGFYS